ncbi:MAG TPA: hypothetical protein VGP67_03570 [Gaiellales bacterium]|nr:hypothetical protein [Gaiellales bacterium]
MAEATDTAKAARDAAWRLGAQLTGPALRAGRDELVDLLFWSEMAQVALAAAAAYADARDRRARRARRRAFLAVTSLTVAGAAAYAVRRR